MIDTSPFFHLIGFLYLRNLVAEHGGFLKIEIGGGELHLALQFFD